LREKTVVLVVALALIPIGTDLHAAARELMFRLSAGIAMPVDDYEDHVRGGFIGGVDFDYVVTERLAIGVNVSFVSNAAADEREAMLATEAGAPVHETLTMLPVSVHCKLLSTMNGLSPYVVLGLGVYSFTEKLQTTSPASTTQESQSKFGARAGLGLTYRINEKVSVGIEGAYHYVDTKLVSPAGNEVRPSAQLVGIQAAVIFGLATAAR
jgi:opacity protein-like surface antigen